MKNRVIRTITAMLTFFMFTSITFAAGFKDVTADHWAATFINQMADQGILNGYPDGTFRPDKGVSNIEALLLCARIFGYKDPNNAATVSKATEMYDSALNGFNTIYKGEVSYLLYRGILSVSELNTYIGTDTQNAVMKRHQVAVLLTKAMGGEATAKANVVTILAYEDSDKIPMAAKPYVQYMRDNNIMLGLKPTLFSPLTEVNRAQMATMLDRVIDFLQMRTEVGILSSYAPATRFMTIRTAQQDRTIYISTAATVMLDGQSVTPETIAVGSEVTLVYQDNDVVAVDAHAVKVDSVIEGALTGTQRGGATQVISIRNLVTGVTSSYNVNQSAVTTKNGKVSSINDLVLEDYIKLSIADGKVAQITAADKMTQLTGVTVEKVIIDPELQLSVKDPNGFVTNYNIDKNLAVTRNTSNATLADVAIGDTVNLVFTYSKITSIVATGINSTVEGAVESITLSKYPSIAITTNGKTKSYEFSRTYTVTIDSKPAKIEDIKVGSYVQMDVEGGTVLAVRSKASAQTVQLTGVVETVNQSYSFINLKVTNPDGSTTSNQIFVKQNANIFRSSDNGTRFLKDINAGDTIIAIGGFDGGVFSANSIIIVVNPK